MVTIVWDWAASTVRRTRERENTLYHKDDELLQDGDWQHTLQSLASEHARKVLKTTVELTIFLFLVANTTSFSMSHLYIKNLNFIFSKL